MGAQDPKSLPWNPDSTSFPSRKDLPQLPNAPKDAAWVWGEDDNIGRLNLLTPTRVAAAAKLIKTGEMVPVDLPLNVPSVPAFERKAFHRNLITLVPGIAYDEEYSMNPQSGTQFDGFRHFAHIDSGKFYNGTTGAEIEDPNCMKCSVHHWAEHGIAGRAVLIDYWTYAKQNGKSYDVFSHHSITWDELNAAAKSQGLDIRPAAQGGDIHIGDILMIRSGWVETYCTKSEDEIRSLGHRKSELGEGNETIFAGIAQEEKMLDWLHDCYFAAVAGDAPAMEAWPTKEKYFLHSYILALWGMPLGEMLDLEKLAETCRKKNQWTFFFTSAPFNTPGGCGTHVNGTAIF